VSGENACVRCRTPLADGAVFCSKCGLDVTAVNEEQETLAMTAAGAPTIPIRSTMRQQLREATEGEYEILNELGRGGMATVFLARDISLDRRVAIKVMASHLLDGEDMADRFKLEARTAAKLSHPHIIPIYAVKESDQTLFFVMKLVEGKALDEIIRKTGPLPIATVRDILAKVGSALGYAHRRGVVHRDIKPGNIMIDEEGTPIVADFGIAKVASASGLTITGTTIGTPSYMSPEQCEAKEVTGASDQYALGILAFQMLTGKLPFEGDSAVTIMYKHCHEELPPLTDFRPDCPQDLLEAVTRMVAKDPADRWPSMEAVIQKLGADATPALGDPIRKQLVQAAKDGDLELLAQLSTGGQALESGTTGEGTPTRRRSPALIGGVVVALGALASMAVLQPWAAAPADLASAVTSPPAVDGTPSPGQEDGAPAGSNGAGVDGGADDTPTTPPDNDVPAGGDTSPGDDAPDAGPSGAGATVTPPPTEPDEPLARRVGSVRLAGVPDRMEPGDDVTLRATVVDRSGSEIPASVVTDCQEHGWSRCGYAWTSSDPTIARVNARGIVSAIAPGQTEVNVTVGGVIGRSIVVVSAESVDRVTIAPGRLTLTVGQTAPLSATVFGRGGEPLSGRPLAWSSSDPSVARVSSEGAVAAGRPGRATITATAEGIRTTADVVVEAAPLSTADAVREVIAQYARALESRDINQVRTAYPGLTGDQEQALVGALAFMEGLRAELSVDSVDDQGDTATARVSGTYFFSADGRAQQAPISFDATFERIANEWRLTSTR